MKTLKQIVEKNCDRCACTGTKKEVYACVTYNVKEWLQQKPHNPSVYDSQYILGYKTANKELLEEL